MNTDNEPIETDNGNNTSAPHDAATIPPPQLNLFELMRKDADPSDTDDNERVLTNPRPSIWDLD